jgi:hypothetical protein
MVTTESGGSVIAWATGRAGGAPAGAAIVGFGAVLWWLSADHPALMPFWAPLDFSPTFYFEKVKFGRPA